MSFDLLAPHYTWMEAMLAGPRLQRCRLAWEDSLAGCRDLLIAGVGHGHCLRHYAQRFPHLRIVSVDASARMLAEAQRRAAAEGLDMARLSFVQATLPEWRPAAASFDAIATPFFLDCFPPEELETVIAALAHGARPEARWLVSDFAVPEQGPARWRALAVHGLMYPFFRAITRLRARRLTPPDGELRKHGFSLAGRRTYEWGLLHADLWVRHGTSERV